MRHKSRPLRSLLLLIAFAIASCAPLPDVSPFSTATRQLASAVRTSGATTVTLVAEGYSKDKSDQLRAAWDARDRAMQGLVRYADSLTAIAQAFKDAKANAINLGDSVERLANSVGLLDSGGGAGADAAISVGKLVATQIAKVKAAQGLERALTEAQPVVDAVADHLGRHLVANRKSNDPSNDASDLSSIYDGLASKIEDQRLLDTKATLDLITVLSARRAALQQGVKDGNAGAVAEVVQLTSAIAEAHATLARLNQPFDEQVRRVVEGRLLAEALATAVDAWATAHSDLANAIKARRPVSIESLTESALEIRALVKRIHDL